MTQIQSFSYEESDKETFQKLEEIAKRERRSKSFLIVEAIRAYVKAHGDGNDSYPLESFAYPGMVALPTAWAPFDPRRLRTESDEALIEIMDNLLARTMEISDETKRRYPTLNGYRDFKNFKTGNIKDTGKARR